MTKLDKVQAAPQRATQRTRWWWFGVLPAALFSTASLWVLAGKEWLWRFDFLAASGLPMLALLLVASNAETFGRKRAWWIPIWVATGVLTLALGLWRTPMPPLEYTWGLVHCAWVAIGLVVFVKERLFQRLDGVWVILWLLSCGQLVVLYFVLPLFWNLNKWFWRMPPKPFHTYGLAATMAVATAFVAWVLLKKRIPSALKVVLLIALGTGLQYGFALVEGRGITALRERAVWSGHAQFAVAAVRQPNIGHVMAHYEELVAGPDLGLFAKSKPPGTLLFYMVTEKLRNWVQPMIQEKEKLKAFQNASTATWPTFSFLAIVPLFMLVRRLFNERVATVSGLFYVLVPSVQLITLHTDQVLYPLLVLTPVLAAFWAFERRSVLWALVAGALAYWAVFFSFGLLLLGPLMVMLGAVAYHRSAPEPTWFGFGKLVVALALGALGVDVLFRAVLGYDVLIRYQQATAFHVQWKGWEPTFEGTLYFAALNLAEFTAWAGFPIMILAFALLRRWFVPGVFSELQKGRESALVLSSTLFCVLCAVAWFGKTQGEVARLWLFMTPFVCVGAAAALDGMAGGRKAPVFWVGGLQWGAVFLTKIRQDFF